MNISDIGKNAPVVVHTSESLKAAIVSLGNGEVHSGRCAQADYISREMAAGRI